MKPEIEKAWTQLHAIKSEYMRGAITHDECKAQCAPHLQKINARAKEISAGSGKRAPVLTYAFFMRAY